MAQSLQLIFYRLENKNQQLWLAIFLGFIFFVFYFSFRVMPFWQEIYDPHSNQYLHRYILYPLIGGSFVTEYVDDYIEFSALRRAFYPLFLNIFEWLGFSYQQIAHLQLLIFAACFSALLYQLLRVGLPLLAMIGVWVIILGYVYMHILHNSLSTESLTFSILCVMLINILSFLQHQKPRNLIYLSLLVGILMGTKIYFICLVAGLILLACCFYYQAGYKRIIKKILLLIFIPMFSMLALENILFHSYHEKRLSLLPVHLAMKASMVASFESFDVSKIDKEYVVLTRLKDDIFPVKNVAYHQENEVAMFVFWYGATTEKLKALQPERENMQAEDILKDLAFKILATHPIEFLQLTYYNYVEFFKAGKGLVALLFLFKGLILLLATIIYGVLLFYQLCRIKPVRFDWRDHFVMFVMVWVQSYMVTVSILTITLTRFGTISYLLLAVAMMVFAFTWLERLYEWRFHGRCLY